MKLLDTVRLKAGITVGAIPEGREDNATAKIKTFLSDIEGGVVLDRDLGGMKYWNVSDLELVKAFKVPKLKWKVEAAPTGKYRSFSTRGWPHANYPGDRGHLAGTIINTENQNYSAYMVKNNTHAPLKVVVYDYSLGVQQRKYVTSKATFATVDEAKAALLRIIEQNPHFVPEELL